MAISTRLTELLKVEHPILLAPMDVVAGGITWRNPPATRPKQPATPTPRRCYRVSE